MVSSTPSRPGDVITVREHSKDIEDHSAKQNPDSRKYNWLEWNPEQQKFSCGT